MSMCFVMKLYEMNDLSCCDVEINRLMLNEYKHEVTIIWNIIMCIGHWG